MQSGENFSEIRDFAKSEIWVAQISQSRAKLNEEASFEVRLAVARPKRRHTSEKQNFRFSSFVDFS